MIFTDLILSAFKNSGEYKNLVYELAKLKNAKRRFPIAAAGLSTGSMETFAAALCVDAGEKALIVSPDEKTSVKLRDSMLNFFGGVYIYPKKDEILAGVNNNNIISPVSGGPFEHERIKILAKVLNGDFDVVITTLDALLQYTMPAEELIESFIDLKFGGSIENMREFLENLASMGYERVDIVEETGKFSVRGGIIDIFSPSGDKPVRLELFGDEIDSMGIFDPLTQRRTENIKEFGIIPAGERQLNKNSKNNQCFLDYFDVNKTILFINESVKVNERQKAAEEIMKETLINLLEKNPDSGSDLSLGSVTLEDFHIEKLKFKTVICDNFLSGQSSSDMRLSGIYSFNSRQTAGFSDGFEILKDDLSKYCENQYKTLVFLDSDAGIKSFADYLEDSGVKYILPEFGKCNNIDDIPEGLVTLVKTPRIGDNNKSRPLNESPLLVKGVPEGRGLQKNTPTPVKMSADILPPPSRKGANAIFSIPGFELPGQKFALITDGGSDKRPAGAGARRGRGESGIVRQSGGKYAKTARQKLMSYTDLSPGDYVVHNNYGIGRFVAVERLEVSGVQKDFIKIAYLGTDILYVPCSQLDLVSKYIGAGSDGGEGSVKLSKMGGSGWTKAKAKAKYAARDIARELIKLYAARQQKKGHAFSEDTEWQKDFESLFEYAETDDQLICSEQIKEDMMNPVPMDRLLCGDVGFGKTEVALRAVFKCVSESMQAAILVPTTILAWQHYQTILSRFREFPVKIEMLSRFRSKKEQDEIIKKLRTGQIDIIIGTHRIIQKDIKFKNLGLLVVDEEQRFGVAHKEKLKQLAENIDVLTLTATPIPRTLNMALSGIRDMSAIEEPPRDRLPVQTYIFEYDENIIAEAVRNEIRRGGQVFYLHNRVETIEQKAFRLGEILGEDIKIGVGHGQMDEGALSKVWRSMLEGEIDILVCTTIIESGIDIPDANTLIIEDADRLGLSQLHQIRGRVGRSNRRAYAYFTYPKNKVLTEIATKRLTAIREYTEFGAGFKIAMRDLEIRGAGNLLGAQQHGQMDAVGYDLYVRILERAVNEEKKRIELSGEYGYGPED
ncbi:MAG: transcription-repair coupling factor, partial [Oscillospiraceae bacterium]|nr:transcription-repair coupling factor [Oscillospiraceae bacterium]